MSGKYALIVANTEYTDPGLAQLTAPGKDAEDFARVLENKEICAFDDVNVLLNQPEHIVRGVIDEFFDQKIPDDLLLLYFSGHGVRDELGSLYLAVKNTIRTRLRSTAIKSDYIREAMDQSRSKRQVIILDCCNSGAFPQGVKAEVGGAMGMVSALQGYGRFLLTASDATQFAWEGNKVIGETQNSLFTHFLLKGLRGDADINSDGKITVDELYDYAYEQIAKATPKQTPTKWASKQEGEIVLRQITRIEDIKRIPLPEDLLNEVQDLRPYVREAAVQKLEKILRGKNIGLAHSARDALEKIAIDENSTYRVAQAAREILISFPLTKQRSSIATPVSAISAIDQKNPLSEKSVSKKKVPHSFENYLRRVEDVFGKIRRLPASANLRSTDQTNVNQQTPPGRLRQILLFVFWLLIVLVTLPVMSSIFRLRIQNVILLFWGFVIIFGAIGVSRGWAKESIVSFSAIVGLTLNLLARKYSPTIASLFEEDVSLFWVRVVTLEIVVYLGYRASTSLSNRASKPSVRNRFQTSWAGLIPGAINGYLIIGSLLFYYVVADYPFMDFITKPADPALLQSVYGLLLYLPPQLLGEPIIYFAFILAFIFVLIIFT